MKKTKLLLAVSIFLIFSLPSLANTYTFTGNGDWSTTSNWQGGVRPPYDGYNGFGDVIVITGTCTLNIDLSIMKFVNNGTIWVKPGGTFNIQSEISGVFHNYDSATMRIDGLLNNYAILDQSGAFDVRGTVNNFQIFTVFRNVILYGGSTFDNKDDLQFSSGQIVAQSGSNFINHGTIHGTVNFAGSAGFINQAILSPGNSPGTATVVGDYTATPTAIHNFEIGGTNSGAFDKLVVGGTATLNGTLNVSLYNGYAPQPTDVIPIVTGAISGRFSNASLPSGYSLIYKANAVEVRGAAVLPVTFLSLSVKPSLLGVDLEWIIENQENIRQYEIEKSINGTDFVKLGAVTASNQKDYRFSDAVPGTKSFYRIKSIGVAGSVSYSSVVKYSNGATSVVAKLFPNPATTSVVVQHPAAETNSNITISSSDGRTVMIQALRTGVQQTTLNVASLPQGIYAVTFEFRGEQQTLKFIKL